MAFLEFKNVRIAGMSAGVPKNIASNLHPTEYDKVSSDYSPEDFVKTTGVMERRYSFELTTSDLCFAAAEKLIADLGWEKSEIEGIIFVSQTPDYILPATSCILQDRLGLSKECYTADVSLGCSGWVYGLNIGASLVGSGSLKKILVMCGDAKGRAKTAVRRLNPLFGSAGTVTALEYQEGAPAIQFHFGTDGSGFDAIIIPDGGSRNQVAESSFEYQDVEGHKLNRLQTWMKGMDVFSFGITTAPKSVKKLAEHFGIDYSSYDYLVLHQANMKMNNMIAKKLKFDSDKVPSSMYLFGNTSSASIPMTIVTELRDKLQRPTKLLCSGFGIGLSWGTVALTLDNVVVSELVNVDDNETDKKHVI